jgi:hypothetical protein
MERKKAPPLCREQGGGAFSPGGETSEPSLSGGCKTKSGSCFRLNSRAERLEQGQFSAFCCENKFFLRKMQIFLYSDAKWQ